MEGRTPRQADRVGSHEGLAFALWLPSTAAPWPGVVILHGAGSCKENHADFARAAAEAGFAALAFDQRGHGASGGTMAPAALADVPRMVRFLGDVEGVDADRVAVRGSSMGGFFAIHAAAVAPEIRAVVAICPAGEEHLRRALKRGELEFEADESALGAWLSEHDLRDAVERIGARPLLLIHAEGDEQIPSAFSQELYSHAREPRKIVILPGGHHRSVQHDPEIQGIALRWLSRSMRGEASRRP